MRQPENGATELIRIKLAHTVRQQATTNLNLIKNAVTKGSPRTEEIAHNPARANLPMRRTKECAIKSDSSDCRKRRAYIDEPKRFPLFNGNLLRCKPKILQSHSILNNSSDERKLGSATEVDQNRLLQTQNMQEYHCATPLVVLEWLERR